MKGQVVVFTSRVAAVKHISSHYPTGQIVFCRNFFAFLPILVFLWQTGGLAFRTTRPLGHLMRGVFGVISMYCFFLSYNLLPLSDTVVLCLPSPISMTVLLVP